MKGLKFNCLTFDKIDEITKEYKGISVWIDGKEVACGFINEVLIKLSKLKNSHEIPHYEIVETRPYFDLFVIELKSK